MFSRLFPLLALLAMLILGCGPSAEPSVHTAVVTPTAEPEASPTPDATKEYLLSLPKWERELEQQKLDWEEQERIKYDAREQAIQWIDWATPECKDFFGSVNCEPKIVELQNSDVCGVKPGNPVESIDDVHTKGHYYITLVNTDGIRSGGYEWIASYGHQAYVDGAVLNAPFCWFFNPTEVQVNP